MSDAAAISIRPDELPMRDHKAQAALARFELRRVASAKEAAFGEAFAALDGEFGPRGEIERRAVVEGWLERPPPHLETLAGRRLVWRYELLVARSKTGGELAGVRDCHVTIDVERNLAVVYLAHTLVTPAYRRSGVAELLRTVPIALARRALSETGAAAGTKASEVLLAAEMEHPSVDDRDSLVRLVAYGRSAFAAIDPRALPYAQPDFRDLAASGEAPRPLPLLAVVRHIDHEGLVTLPIHLAAAFVEHLYAVFATHCRRDDLEPPRARALAGLASVRGGEVSLIGLPIGMEDLGPVARLAASAPLSR